MTKTNKTPDFLKATRELRSEASRYAAIEATNFFKESFVKQGFTDSTFEPWTKSTSPLAGKRALFKSGGLMRSIRPSQRTQQRVVVESDMDYSEIQNNGGEVVVTAQMKKYFWAQYYRFAGKVKVTSKGSASKSKANIAVSGKAAFCRNMALKKVGSKMKIPKRQYMGESRTLMSCLDKWAINEIQTRFKNL